MLGHSVCSGDAAPAIAKQIMRGTLESMPEDSVCYEQQQWMYRIIGCLIAGPTSTGLPPCYAEPHPFCVQPCLGSLLPGAQVPPGH